MNQNEIGERDSALHFIPELDERGITLEDGRYMIFFMFDGSGAADKVEISGETRKDVGTQV